MAVCFGMEIIKAIRWILQKCKNKELSPIASFIFFKKATTVTTESNNSIFKHMLILDCLDWGDELFLKLSKKDVFVFFARLQVFFLLLMLENWKGNKKRNV